MILSTGQTYFDKKVIKFVYIQKSEKPKTTVDLDLNKD